MRKLTLFCAATLLAAPIAASAAFAQPQPIGQSDTPFAGPRGAAEAAAAGANALTRLPEASAAVIQAMKFPSTAGGGEVTASSYSDGNKTYPGFLGSAASPRAYGSAGTLPYTTSRTESYNNSTVAAPANDPVTDYPFRATGKLYSQYCVKTANNAIHSPMPCTAADEELVTFVCTASLIKHGVLVTAAHCVHVYDKEQLGYADVIWWRPALYGTTPPGLHPYGTYRARFWVVPSQYYFGTDTCAQFGVICNNDIALIVLWNNNDFQALNNEAQAGAILGNYSYGTNGYSFITSTWLGNRLAAQVSQLGYPEGLDGGDRQQRTDAVAIFVNWTPSNTRNIIWGSAQTGGSSGGPEIVNLGRPPVYGGVTEPQSPGTAAGQAVVGVTSWKYSDINQRILGASWFGANAQYPDTYAPYGVGNIAFLVRFVCTHATYGPQCS